MDENSTRAEETGANVDLEDELAEFFTEATTPPDGTPPEEGNTTQTEDGGAAAEETTPPGGTPPEEGNNTPPDGAPSGEETTPPLRGTPPGEGNSSPEMLLIQQMARESGMTVEQFIADTNRIMEENQRAADERKVEEKFDQLVEQGVPEDIALKHAQMEVNAERFAAEEQRRAVEAQRQGIEEKVHTDRMNADVQRFFAAYPDAAKAEVTEAVLADIKAGMTPMEAYQRKEIAELRLKLDKQEKQEKNKEVAAGSVKGGKVEQDEFMGAFFGVFNE